MGFFRKFVGDLFLLSIEYRVSYCNRIFGFFEFVNLFILFSGDLLRVCCLLGIVSGVVRV